MTNWSAHLQETISIYLLNSAYQPLRQGILQSLRISDRVNRISDTSNGA